VQLTKKELKGKRNLLIESSGDRRTPSDLVNKVPHINIEPFGTLPPFKLGNVIIGRAYWRLYSYMDAFERLLWWLFAGSTGAGTRAQVLQAIKAQPRNAQQLSQALHLDYTTVRHHLRVLERNRLLTTEGDKYGKLYFVSDVMEANWSKLDDILRKTGRGEKQ
jgi:DNA-binding transcriptional ArsR family regulator